MRLLNFYLHKWNNTYLKFYFNDDKLFQIKL